MKEDKNSIEENAERLEDVAVSASESAENASPVDSAVADILSDTAEQDANAADIASDDAPAVEAPSARERSTATVASDAPGYGAPQMLYEDFIPYEYLHDSASPEAKEEVEQPPVEEKKKKDKKPSREEAELLAAVEAEMASHAEAAPIESEPAQAPVEEAPVQEIVVAPVAPVAVIHEEDNMPEDNTTTREYTSYEKKLRRKYKIDKDNLLSSNDVIPGFVLAKGETVVRCYNCLDSRKGDGTLCLTNKRLLINADERSEVEVDTITGIKFSKNTFFSFFKFLFALLFFGIGAFMVALPFIKDSVNIPKITGADWKGWYQYLFIACGAVSLLISLPLWIKMIKKSFYFHVYIREGSPFLECKSWAVIKREKKGTQYSFIVSDAGKECEKAARELGALILEVKEGRYNI